MGLQEDQLSQDIVTRQEDMAVDFAEKIRSGMLYWTRFVLERRIRFLNRLLDQIETEGIRHATAKEIQETIRCAAIRLVRRTEQMTIPGFRGGEKDGPHGTPTENT